jgi:hypothetical protein
VNKRELDKNAARRLAIIRHARKVSGNVTLTCRFSAGRLRRRDRRSGLSLLKG